MSVTDGVDADRRPVHKKRRARRKSSTRRFDGAIRSTFFWASMAIVVLGILPIVVNAVAGLAMGTIPDGDVLGKGPDYPLVPWPFVLMGVPGLAMLALAIVTLPRKERGARMPRPEPRHPLLCVAALTATG